MKIAEIPPDVQMISQIIRKPLIPEDSWDVLIKVETDITPKNHPTSQNAMNGITIQFFFEGMDIFKPPKDSSILALPLFNIARQI